MNKFWNSRRFFAALCLAGIIGCLGIFQTATEIWPHKTFGLVCMTMNNEFYSVIESKLLVELESRKDELICLDPQLDLDKQIEEIYWLIDQGVDGLFINPMDSSRISEPVQKAMEKGIPVVILDAPLSEDADAITTIVSDNRQAGKLCAEDMMEQLDSAKIGLLLHSEVESARDRIDGFLEAIKDHPEYEVVASRECQGQLEKAMPQVENMLQEHPDLDVIMALNDPSALGALAALESSDIENILVYGVDGTPDLKKKMSAGSAVRASAAQSPASIGQKAAQAMYDWLEGREVPKEQVLPVELITPENLQNYSISGWQ